MIVMGNPSVILFYDYIRLMMIVILIYQLNYILIIFVYWFLYLLSVTYNVL